MPLVREGFDWEHGVFLGSIMSSEMTAAAVGTIGKLRFDPFAMLPFCGYNMADYWAHWLEIGQKAGARLPRIYLVNWFRKDAERQASCGPASARTAASSSGSSAAAPARTTRSRRPIGLLPAPGAIDTTRPGHRPPPTMAALLAVDPAAWVGGGRGDRGALRQVRLQAAGGAGGRLEQMKSGARRRLTARSGEMTCGPGVPPA